MREFDQLINNLYKFDTIFIEYWDGLSQQKKKVNKKLVTKIDNNYQLSYPQLIAANKESYHLSKRYFHLIPQKDFSYIDNITNQWQDFLHNNQRKSAICESSKELVNTFILTNSLKKKVDFYGGIKSLQSIKEKINKEKNAENYLNENIFNIWDIVRYRLVVNNIKDLLVISFLFWEYFYDDIIRCRNYYYNPVNCKYSKHYKGINFVISHEDVFFEVQLLTKIKEINSYLDYYYLYKERYKLHDFQLENWLKSLLLKSNLYELKEVGMFEASKYFTFFNVFRL